MKEKNSKLCVHIKSWAKLSITLLPLGMKKKLLINDDTCAIWFASKLEMGSSMKMIDFFNSPSAFKLSRLTRKYDNAIAVFSPSLNRVAIALPRFNIKKYYSVVCISRSTLPIKN